MNSRALSNKNIKKTNIKQPSLIKQYIKHIDLVLMFLPGFMGLIIFKYLPLYGITIAFKDFKMLDGIMGSPWVGLENFKTLFFGADFLLPFRNTLIISLLKMAFTFPAPIILALLINEVTAVKFKKIVQTLSYIPYFFSWVVLSGIITMVFSTHGPVNMIVSRLGVDRPLEFFADGNLFLGMLVTTAVWKGIGWGSIIYLAALSGIDEALYEAAKIDGANKWQQTMNISIPCLVPVIVTVFILGLGSILNAGFDQIYNLYNPTVYDVSDILDTYVLRKMQSMDYSLGTAAGLFKSAICFVLILICNFVINRISDNELGIL